MLLSLKIHLKIYVKKCWDSFKNEKNEFVLEEFSIPLKEPMFGPNEYIFEKENNIDNEFKSCLNGMHKLLALMLSWIY